MMVVLTEIGNENNILGGYYIRWMTLYLVCLSGGTGDSDNGKSDLMSDLISSNIRCS